MSSQFARIFNNMTGMWLQVRPDQYPMFKWVNNANFATTFDREEALQFIEANLYVMKQGLKLEDM
jgi:hypothetical protein